MAHRNFKNKSFKRKKKSLSLRKLFLIACEGEKTEPNYINDLVQSEKDAKRIAIGSKVLIVNHQHTDPCGVLTDLCSDPNYEDAEQRWIVIDRDAVENIKSENGGHTQKNFDEALCNASEKGVSVAYSNPCFELWLILHFEYRDSSSSRIDVQKKALQLLKKNKLLKPDAIIDDLKAEKGLFTALGEKRLEKAIKGAEKLYEKNSGACQNPCTTFHKLIEAIKSF
ncbi:MAG: RloB family protein [Fibrobacteraceae bacterium]|nr:RloB family protein [Fibrobacteraceae bacterium]